MWLNVLSAIKEGGEGFLNQLNGNLYTRRILSYQLYLRHVWRWAVPTGTLWIRGELDAKSTLDCFQWSFSVCAVVSSAPAL